MTYRKILTKKVITTETVEYEYILDADAGT